MRDDGAFLGESLDVRRFLFDEAQRYKDREVRVDVSRLFEHAIEHSLDVLPDRVTPRSDHHAAANIHGVLREFGGFNDLLIPLGVVFSTSGTDRVLLRLSHLSLRFETSVAF